MREMLYADDLVLTGEMMGELREKFWKWKEAFESEGLKVNLGKTKVVVTGAEGEVSVSKVDPCDNCGKRIMENSVLLVEPVNRFCEEVETVRGFCYLGYRVDASGGCEAAVTARASSGWVQGMRGTADLKKLLA